MAVTPQALGAPNCAASQCPRSSRQPLPAPALALLRARFPGAVVQARSAGALRADGGRDIAVVLAASPGADADATLALLVAQADGSLRLAATSGSLARACRGCDVQVQIAHHALVVQTMSTDTAGTHIVGYQFMAAARDKPGALRLLGVRTVQADRSGADSRRYVNTANLRRATSWTWSRTSRTAAAGARSTRASCRCARRSRSPASRSTRAGWTRRRGATSIPEGCPSLARPLRSQRDSQA